jgi:hypothetical protein
MWASYPPDLVPYTPFSKAGQTDLPPSADAAVRGSVSVIASTIRDLGLKTKPVSRLFLLVIAERKETCGPGMGRQVTEIQTFFFELSPPFS